MSPIVIRLFDTSVGIDAPVDLHNDLARFFGHLIDPSADPVSHIAITSIGGDEERYFLDLGMQLTPKPALKRGELLLRLARALGDRIAPEPGPAVLRAGAVAWGERSIVVAGLPGTGASSLVAWLIDSGFAYLADDTVVVQGEGVTVTGHAGPMSFVQEKAGHLATLPAFREAPSVPFDRRLLIAPDPTWIASAPTMHCGLIVYVAHRPGAPLTLEPVSARRAPFRLLEATRDVILPDDAGFTAIAAMAERTPALSLRYGSYQQLTGVLDFLVRTLAEAEVEPGELGRFLAGLPRQAGPATTAKVSFPVPARTERSIKRPLTIGMATYDDYDGVYFSIQALRMYHPEIVDEIELLVIDNHPDGRCAAPLKALENDIPNYRYVPAGDVSGTAIRNRIFDEAGGDFVSCMDCHVFIVPGAMRRLLDYFAANPRTRDLVQGPMIGDDFKRLSTHFAPQWREGMYGTWAHDPAGDDPGGPPFEIPMQGLGLFACRRDVWPGFNPRFRGFGGEEGYIHEKFRRAGGRTLCLPFLRWMHRFRRPNGVPYVNRWEDRFRNYLIGFHELGLPTGELENHLREKMGEAAGQTLIEKVRAELARIATGAVHAG